MARRFAIVAVGLILTILSLNVWWLGRHAPPRRDRHRTGARGTVRDDQSASVKFSETAEAYGWVVDRPADRRGRGLRRRRLPHRRRRPRGARTGRPRASRSSERSSASCSCAASPTSDTATRARCLTPSPSTSSPDPHPRPGACSSRHCAASAERQHGRSAVRRSAGAARAGRAHTRRRAPGALNTRVRPAITASTSCVSASRRSARKAPRSSSRSWLSCGSHSASSSATESSAHSVVPLKARMRAGRVLARLDRHVADGEDIRLELRLVELEPVAGPRMPHQPRLAQRESRFRRDHAPIMPRMPRPRAAS